MYIIGNGTVVTRDNGLLITDGAVATENGRIAAVGKSGALRQAYPAAAFIDARGGLIMPGLINCHEHIYSAMARGLSVKGYAPKGFLDILAGMWWNIDRHLLLEQTRLSALATYIECIKYGVTTIFDHHASYAAVEGSLFAIAEQALALGVRSCLCYEVSDRDGADKARAAIRENAEFIRYTAARDDDMLHAMMGLHAQFTLSDDTLALCRANTPAGVGYHIHVAEGVEDLHACLRQHGKRVVDRLMDHGILGPQTIAAHCVYVNSHEIELLRETGTMVVHNPESNMGNACGCPPTMEIFRRGVLTGLGTDGYTHDMFESYKVANILHKHHLCDPGAAWAEVPAMLFENNAKIAGRYFGTPLGVLREGAAADVIVVEYDPPTALHSGNINGHLLFGVNGSRVVTTMCNGKLLMRDRALLVADEAEAMAKCRAGAAKLWQSISG